MNRKIFIVAGDPSGSVHAARLMDSLKSIDSTIEFYGIGGLQMETAGLQSLVDLRTISVVGFWEVAKRYFFFKNLIRQCVEVVRREGITTFIAIDYPGFNMALSRELKSIGVRVIWYIAPQLWAWGRGRAKKFSAAVDELLVVFPFEEKFFTDFHIRTHFVGHPLLDNPTFTFPAEDDSRSDFLGIFPGSREQEVRRHLPIMLQVARIVEQSSGLVPLLARSENVSHELFDQYNGQKNSNYVTMDQAKVGLVKAGTTTLECALKNLPIVVMYRASAISYAIGKRLLTLPYVSLPNILLGRELIPEFIQNQAKIDRISGAIMEVQRPEQQERLRSGYAEIRSLLGGAGASQRAAVIIASSI